MSHRIYTPEFKDEAMLQVEQPSNLTAESSMPFESDPTANI